MRKIRSLIAAFLVVLIQITPGPFGLRPAFAVAPPSTEWVTMSSSGGVEVMVRQGHDSNGTISPPTVDNATAKVSMPLDTGYVYQDQSTGTKRFVQSSTGGIMEVDLASGTAKQIVDNDPSSYPKLKPVFDAALPDVPIKSVPSQGDTYSTPAGNRSISTVGSPIASSSYHYPGSPYDTAKKQFVAALTPIGGDRYVTSTNNYMYYDFSWEVLADGRGCMSWKYVALSTIATGISPSPVPSKGDTLDPGKVSSGLTSSGFPNGTGLNGEILQVGKKGAGTITGRGGNGVLEADIPNMPGFGGAAGDGSPIVSDVPKDPTKDDSDEDGGDYTPEPNGDPYPQDPTKIDFSQRMGDFFTSAKQSAIFSLPTSFASDIPSGSSSGLTIQANSIFGQPISFDFSSMDYMWAILRTVNLSGFSFIAIRIVCLKH